MTTISDDFNRADSSSLGANWTEDSGDWEIQSNTLRQQTSGGNYRKCRWTGTALSSNDYTVQCTGRSSTDSLGFGVFGRGAASSTVTYYALLGFGGDAFYLVEITAGGENVLDTGSACTASTTYTLQLKCNGSAIEGYVNGALDVSATDATLSSGAVGLMTYGQLDGTNDWLDNFTASDLVSSSIKKLGGVEIASIKKASGVAVASIKKIAGVSNV